MNNLSHTVELTLRSCALWHLAFYLSHILCFSG